MDSGFCNREVKQLYGLTLGDVARLVRGELHGGSPQASPTGATIDTRKLEKGDLFFALSGTKTDGHAFLGQAREKGAIGAIVTRIPGEESRLGDFPLILVKDAEKALQQTAIAQRKLFSGPVVAITGSTGKTTTKDMLASVLREKGQVLSTAGNYNNQLGLPLTILALQPEHWALITEMGMRGLGEIDFLSVLARPTHGIITNIGHTHQELLGTQARIAQAKAELISHIPGEGAMALNLADKPLLKPWLSNLRCPVTWFAGSPPGDIWPEEVRSNMDLSFDFKICSKEGRYPVSLTIPGRHNVLNALAPAAIARRLGLSWEEIGRGLAGTRLSAMRLEILQLPKREITLINDAYNANPASMSGALEVLRTVAGEKRTIAVLGDMYELGDYAQEGHRLIGRKAKEQGVAYLITVGQLAREIAYGAISVNFPRDKVMSCQNNQEALSYLMDILQPGDAVLIKGSRGVGMEEIVAGLQG